MTHSRSPHCVLTERVVENVSGKGREGNKEGKGNRVETSPSILTFCNASRATEPNDKHRPHATRNAWMGEA